MTRKISHGVLKLPIDCIYLSNVLFATDAWAENSAIHVFDINSECVKNAKTITNLQFGFLFGICKYHDENVLVSDLKSHCVFKVSSIDYSVACVIGQAGQSGQKDGTNGLLNSPSGIASTGEGIYIAEHRNEIQGAVRFHHSLQGLVNFQTIWGNISRVFGMVSKREGRMNEPGENLK